MMNKTLFKQKLGREMTSLKEKNEKLRFARTVGATLKHEVFNPLQAIAFANKTMMMKFGKHSGNQIITDNVLRLRDMVNRLADLSELLETKYVDNSTIIDLQKCGGKLKAKKA